MKTNINIIHGNQIGGCITVISTDKSKIIIDFGESLPGTDTFDDIPFDWENEQVDAVFFTHYHGDHIGRFAEIPNAVPLYMGEVTYKVMKNINDRIGKKEIAALLENRGNIHFVEPTKAVAMHTSGHAYPEFIEQVINAVNPTEVIIPIHTEAIDEFPNLNIHDELKRKITIQ